MEPEAKWLWRDDKYHEPFSRHYAPESLVEKIVPQILRIKQKILFFTNVRELSELYWDQHIFCHFMSMGGKL